MLYRCSVVMAIVLLLFIMHSFRSIQHLSYGWVALMGLLLLLIINNEQKMEHWLHQVEWSTLLFIATLFVLMECLGELGLIGFLGLEVEKVIVLCPPKYRSTVAICLVLWVRY